MYIAYSNSNDICNSSGYSRKPNPEVYKYALKELGISANDAVAIEDTTVNQSCAVQSGIECHLFPGEYATIGHKDMVGKKFISEKLEFSKIIV